MSVIYIFPAPLKAASFPKMDDKITVFIALLSCFVFVAIICFDICGWELEKVCFYPGSGSHCALALPTLSPGHLFPVGSPLSTVLLCCCCYSVNPEISSFSFFTYLFDTQLTIL